MQSALWSVSAMLTVSAAGCAGRFDPAHFEGSRQPRRAEPEVIAELAARTDQYETLGRVHATCRLQPGFRSLDGESLSDVDCSAERLHWALRESAANAGGEALVGVACGSRRLGASSSSSATYLVACAADVARLRVGPVSSPSPLLTARSASAILPAPSAGAVERIDDPVASLAFRVTVSFTPTVAAFAGRSRPSAEVNELSLMPVADRPLGDLSTSCAGACDERALRYGVLIAAGRLGAPDVVGVRCFETGAGHACVGTLAAPTVAE